MDQKEPTEDELEQRVAEDIYMKQLIQLQGEQQNLANLQEAISADLQMKQQIQSEGQESTEDMLEKEILEEVNPLDKKSLIQQSADEQLD